MSQLDRVDAVVIGAGVVGLACARQLARAGRETVILERESAIGQGISSRNSEVIHAGLYYLPGSLKARLCVRGRELLYDYCASHGVEHARPGKWIVATRPEQVPRLEELARRAEANGVTDIELIDREQARSGEPALACTAVLVSPSTGIIDSHGLMLALQGDFEAEGGAIAFDSPVVDGVKRNGRFRLQIGGESPSRVETAIVVNATGLDAPSLAKSIASRSMASVPATCYAKGNYFALDGKAPFSRLIYPLPEPGGLGIHLTLDLQGGARFGPDVEWVDAPEYHVTESRRDRFVEAIRSYWPDADINRLHPAFAGVRPKLGSPESPHDDFMIHGTESHGETGLVNLFGIESPGLTASLAIAEEVADRLSLN
jgi:D-amino-acid oxidase